MAELLGDLQIYPNVVELRQQRMLAGLLALSRGDTDSALLNLRAAEELLPRNGIPTHWHTLPDHVPLWYALAQAEMEAGRPQLAAVWLERILQSQVEHVEFPIRYVRSFYLLAKIRQREGKSEQARQLYRRFVDFWGDGDVDRERVAEAGVW